MKKSLILGLLIFVTSGILANTHIDTSEDNWTYGNMHQWRAHSAFSNIDAMAVTRDKVFALSNHSLFAVDKQSEELFYYSRLTGLNGAVISTIGYNEALNLLLVCYDNGQLDVINAKEEIENVPDLYLKQTNSSKVVNDICMHGHTAYLAMDFGILVLDMKKREIKDTYIIGQDASEVSVKYITTMGDSIYAVSPQLLYAASLSDPLSDYAYWHSYSLPKGKQVTGLCAYDQQLYIVRDNILWSRNATQWQKQTTTYPIKKLCKTEQQLFLLPKDNKGAAMVGTDLSLQWQEMGEISDIAEDGQSLWFASTELGLVRGSDRQSFYPDGPINNTAYRMRFFGDRLYVVPGGRWATQNETPGEIMFYENGTWVNVSNEKINEACDATILDLMNVAQDPNDKDHYFVTSYGSGMLEMYGEDVIKLYTPSNSALVSAAPNAPNRYTRTDGAMFDDKGYLWVLNTEVENNILIMDAQGNKLATYSLYSNSVRVPLYTPGEIIVDRRNPQWKWIPLCRYNTGLVLLQDNGTPLNSKDDKVTYHNEWYDQDGKPILPEFIYSLAQDHDNTMWVGTNKGLFLIPSTVDFTISNQCERVIISRNDGTQLGDYLLDNEQINHIVVDGGNRKWIATASSGVFLLSPDGKETIQHFTVENSPLPSNNVLSIAIMESTGEVFFGTNQGLVSYMSDAIEPAENLAEIYAYPNPVHPTYHGIITIRGLMADTQVRIVDASGNLVATVLSNGGEAVWDMTNTQGQRVASGVYTALCNTTDGTGHGSTKILIMN